MAKKITPTRKRTDKKETAKKKTLKKSKQIKTAAKKKKKKKKGALGKWGAVKFTVSAKTIRTFTDMSWTTNIRYETKERNKKVSKVTFKGIDPDTVSFKMRFSVFSGLKPYKEMQKLESAARKAQANRLLIGGKLYGHDKTVITGLTRSLKYFDRKGNLWIAEVSVSLKEKP